MGNPLESRPSQNSPAEPSPNFTGAGAALRLRHFQFCFRSLSPARPWLQRTAGKPALFATTCFGQDPGAPSAVLSTFREGKAGRPRGTSQAKQANRAHLELGPGPTSCAVELGNAKSATLQPLPCKAISVQGHCAGATAQAASP